MRFLLGPHKQWELRYLRGVLGDKVLIKSIKKGADILRLFSVELSVLSLAQISKALGWHRPTALRICNTLVDVGFLERIDDGLVPVYRLGLWIAQLNRVLIGTIDIRKEALRYLQHLANEVGYTSYLMIRSGTRMVCVDRIPGVFIVQAVATEVGDSLPLYRGGGPTAVLAFLPIEVQKEAFSELAEHGDWSAKVERNWQMRLDKIKREGYSVSKNEVYEGTAAVGAPIFNVAGEPFASISLGGVMEGFSRKSIPKIAKEVLQAAKAISKRLGYDGNAK